MATLAAFAIDKLPVKDGEQPGAQTVLLALLAAPAQGTLDGGLHQVVGATGVAGQPQGEAPQSLEHLAQLLVI
ncbi:hypothetical protein D3C77_706970 [compost metagenome]